MQYSLALALSMIRPANIIFNSPDDVIHMTQIVFSFVIQFYYYFIDWTRWSSTSNIDSINANKMVSQ